MAFWLCESRGETSGDSARLLLGCRVAERRNCNGVKVCHLTAMLDENVHRFAGFTDRQSVRQFIEGVPERGGDTV